MPVRERASERACANASARSPFVALAVFATLAYLSVQIRQTKEIWRTQSYHLAIAQLVAGAMHLQFSLLFASQHRELSEEERERLAPVLGAFIYGHEVVYSISRAAEQDLLRDLQVDFTANVAETGRAAVAIAPRVLDLGPSCQTSSRV